MTTKATPLRATVTGLLLLLLLLSLMLFTRAASATTGSTTARLLVPKGVTNKECLDDPEFRMRKKKRKKNGDVVVRTCAWLNKVSAKKRDRICKKNKWGKNGKKVLEGCPVTCESCQDEIPDDNGCPLDAPDSIACSVEQKGIECGYDYRYAGCVPEDLVCAPAELYGCDTESQTWSVALADPPSCKETPTEFAGQPCDSQDFCPKFPPDHGSECYPSTDAHLNIIRGRGCYYTYVFAGCSFHSGMSCNPVEEAICTESGTWESFMTGGEPCSPPFDPTVPLGVSCEPCPSVEPAAPLCPPKEPQDGDDCSLYSINEVCKYNLTYQGCSTAELKCLPKTSYTCVANGSTGNWKLTDIDSVDCPP